MCLNFGPTFLQVEFVALLLQQSEGQSMLSFLHPFCFSVSQYFDPRISSHLSSSLVSHLTPRNSLSPPSDLAVDPPTQKFGFRSTQRSTEDSKIDASEFLQIQLLRTGAVDKETLEPDPKRDLARIFVGAFLFLHPFWGVSVTISFLVLGFAVDRLFPNA